MNFTQHRSPENARYGADLLRMAQGGVPAPKSGAPRAAGGAAKPGTAPRGSSKQYPPSSRASGPAGGPAASRGAPTATSFRPALRANGASSAPAITSDDDELNLLKNAPVSAADGDNLLAAAAAEKSKPPRPTLRESDILGETGLWRLYSEMQRLPIRGTAGHEASDLRTIVRAYHVWAKALCPRMHSSDALERVATWSGKAMVKSTMMQLRVELEIPRALGSATGASLEVYLKATAAARAASEADSRKRKGRVADMAAESTEGGRGAGELDSEVELSDLELDGIVTSPVAVLPSRAATAAGAAAGGMTGEQEEEEDEGFGDMRPRVRRPVKEPEPDAMDVLEARAEAMEAALRVQARAASADADTDDRAVADEAPRGAAEDEQRGGLVRPLRADSGSESEGALIVSAGGAARKVRRVAIVDDDEDDDE